MWKIWGVSFIFLWMKIVLNAMEERVRYREVERVVSQVVDVCVVFWE